jgi:prepilin-type N-terminal cleavage/methylation domain-containing protein
MRKAFTLAETLIVIIIVGILAAVLIESYMTITKIAFKIEQEKNLSEEALMITQIFQSLADTATIDYERYGTDGKK